MGITTRLLLGVDEVMPVRAEHSACASLCSVSIGSGGAGAHPGRWLRGWELCSSPPGGGCMPALSFPQARAPHDPVCTQWSTLRNALPSVSASHPRPLACALGAVIRKNELSRGPPFLTPLRSGPAGGSYWISRTFLRGGDCLLAGDPAGWGSDHPPLGLPSLRERHEQGPCPARWGKLGAQGSHLAATPAGGLGTPPPAPRPAPSSFPASPLAEAA